jgi:hypothetical protein
MYRDIAHAVYKRGEAHFEGYQLPSWSIWLVLLDFVIFLPLMLLVNYTFHSVLPTLAMIEDPSPPAYEPVSLNDDTQSLPEELAVPKLANERAHGADTRAVTSSFRSTLKTLKSVSGWTSLYRGLGCYLTMYIATAFIGFSLCTFLPSVIALPIAGVLALQLYTTWIHVVISAPSPKSFWRRMPPLKQTFKATALPIALVFLAVEITHVVPRGLSRLLGMTMWDPSQPDRAPAYEASDVWKGLIVLVTGLGLQVFVAIPAQVVLTRVQASLLPEEDETIVPFDRSFQGKLEPAIVGGTGYVTIRDAWATFSRASWVRLVKLYVKIFGATIAVGLFCAAILVPETLLVARYTKGIE